MSLIFIKLNIMKKLCIVLSSSYDKNCPGFFNTEVQQDLEIVREALEDYQLLEMVIPAVAGNQLSKKKIRHILNLLDIQEPTQCHIVINTHGSPGYSDIRHECIIDLVDYLSRMNIEITQISALQCEGMKRLENSLNQYKTPWSGSAKMVSKDSNLHKLQRKLNALTLQISQQFKIYGFDEAYVPFENKLEIINLLTGNSGHELAVNILSKPILTTSYFYQILDGVEQLLNHQNLPRASYRKLANFFSKLQHDMKENILLALYQHQEIPKDSELWPLWQSLNQYANETMQHFNAENPLHIASVYKNWLKNHKLYSFERLNIFKEFAHISLNKINNVTSFEVNTRLNK